MRIAVTGATGFVGRYLMRRLVAAGHQLRCWYRAGNERPTFKPTSFLPFLRKIPDNQQKDYTY